MMVSDPPAAPQASPGSEDVQSNLVLRGDGASGDDVTSAALPPGGAHSCWAGPAVPAASGAVDDGSSGAGWAAPPLPEQLPEGRQQQGSAAPAALPEQLAWQALATSPPHGSAGGSGGLGGSGAGSGPATMTGVSLGVVPSLSGGAVAAVPQAAPRLRVRRQPDSGSAEQQQQQQQERHAPPHPQATNEAQQVVSPRADGAADTVQQPFRATSTVSAPEVGTAAPPPAEQQPPDLQAGHKRARACSPTPT